MVIVGYIYIVEILGILNIEVCLWEVCGWEVCGREVCIGEKKFGSENFAGENPVGQKFVRHLEIFTTFLIWFASWLPSSVPFHITFDQAFITSFSGIFQQNSSPKSVVTVRGLREVYARCGRSGQCGSTARLCMDCAFPQQECSRYFVWHGLIGLTWSYRGFPWCGAS